MKRKKNKQESLRKFKMLAVKNQEIYKVPLKCVEEFKVMAEEGEKAFAIFLKENLKKENKKHDKKDT